MSLRRIAGRNARRVTGAVQAMMGGAKPDSFLSSFLATADDVVDVQSGDVHSWVSRRGGITWHRPAYYTKTGNAPAFNAAAFSGGRAGVVFDAANTEALIADSGSGFTNGVGDNLSWTVAAHVLITTDGCVISTGRQASSTPYASHRTDLHMSLRDDASANGTVSAASAVEGSEHVIVWTQQGVTKRFWVDGVPLGGNPYTGASQGQRTIDQMAMGALFIGDNSWSTYLTGAVRRVGAGPAYCTDAQAAALSTYWLNS